MRMVQILVEWIACSVEVALYLILMQAVSEEKFRGKKQTVSFVFVLAVVSSGVVLLNMPGVSISLPTLLYAVFSYALGAAILYRGRFPEYLFASIGFVSALTLVDTMTVLVLRWAGMGNAVAGILSGQGIYRVLALVTIKIFEAAIVLWLRRGIRRAAGRLGMPGGYAAALACLFAGTAGSIYLITQVESLVGFELSLFQTLLGVSLVLAVCMAYFILRIREAAREQDYVARQNRILE